jgi:hypothetical protein
VHPPLPKAHILPTNPQIGHTIARVPQARTGITTSGAMADTGRLTATSGVVARHIRGVVACHIRGPRLLNQALAEAKDPRHPHRRQRQRAAKP